VIVVEIWKNMIYQGLKYEKFEVSNYGRLRNVFTGTIYKLNMLKTGYYAVCISLGSRKNKKSIRVHKAVAETFIENTKHKPYVNHKDGNKTNNYIDNLEWVTQKENIIHAYNNNLINTAKGEKVFGSKLSNEDVWYIRKVYIPKDKQFGARALGRKFNVRHSIISSIINNKTWKHI
jgi:hypothetical protein